MKFCTYINLASGHSTLLTALLHLVDGIKNNIENNMYTGMVLIDLQKAFDTVNHNILLNKLKAVGLDNFSVKWFKSYLDDRKQFVKVHDSLSNEKPVVCGVPQGSILGPLLFLIYVNDMSRAVSCSLNLYADDSALIVSGKNVEDVEKNLSTNLESLCNWLVDNKLSIHLGKTESILFASRNKLKKCSEIKISCNNVLIDSKECVKYLGAYIEQDLSGSNMVNTIFSKLNSCIKFLYRNKSFLGLRERKLLCNSLLQPRFDYACIFWYKGLTKALKSKLQVSQNKAIRLVLNLNPRHHIDTNCYVKLKWVNVESRVDFLILCLMYKIHVGTAPSYLSNMLRLNHCHGTRYNTNSFVIPHCGTIGKTTFEYNGIVMWNQLPIGLKQCTNIVSFKQKCKSYLLQKLITSEECEYI